MLASKDDAAKCRVREVAVKDVMFRRWDFSYLKHQFLHKRKVHVDNARPHWDVDPHHNATMKRLTSAAYDSTRQVCPIVGHRYQIPDSEIRRWGHRVALRTIPRGLSVLLIGRAFLTTRIPCMHLRGLTKWITIVVDLHERVLS